ncbi:MAG: 30S ribosomal protein S17e [Candidatus Hecatellaceae archaeon]
MGRIRTGLVKRISRSLVEKYPNLFTTDYERNKEILGHVLEVDSKKLKDQIAGYITHLMRMRTPKAE